MMSLKADIPMLKYEVVILPLAEQDIQDNTDYIAFKKKAPDTAIKLAKGFRKTIEGLSNMLVNAKPLLLHLQF